MKENNLEAKIEAIPNKIEKCKNTSSLSTVSVASKYWM